MPIYDYRCDHCGHAFSRVQSFTDSSLERCPSCGKRPRRLIAAPAIVFKGSGWYSTDSRKATGGAAASDGAKAESKTADKPAEKTPDKPTDKPAEKPADKSSKAEAAS